MTTHSHANLERQLLLETTLFQEETTPEALSALLDQLEEAPVPFSPKAEWARFRAAHPEHFPRYRLRRAAPWAAAACLALAALLPAAGQLSQAAEPSPSQETVSPAADRAVLYRLAGIAPLGAERPFDSQLVEGPAALPFDGELAEGPTPLPFDGKVLPLPYYNQEDLSDIQEGYTLPSAGNHSSPLPQKK